MTKPFSYEEAAAPRTESFSYEDASGEPPKPASAMRKLGDLGLGFASGAVGATKAIADAAGAGNKASSVLSSLNTGINDYLSPAAKADQQEQGKILADASGKGTWEGVKAGARAFGVAPVQTAVQGIGSIVPILAGTALTGGAVPAAVVGAGIGAAMGAGTAKGAIYDEIKKRGGTEEEAIKAQEYGGANTDQIALGGALGTADALTGVSKMAGNMARNAMGKPVLGTAKEASRGIVGRSAMGMLSEMPLEAAQGGQEQVAANIAAQRAGYQAGTWDNVASNATMESLASAGPGAAFGAMDTGKKTLPPVAPPPAVPPAPPADPMLALPAPSIVVGPDGTATTAQDRNARLSRIADGDITDVTPIQKPSEQMGIDPAAGVISAVAAQAVDNGHAQEIQQTQADAQDQAAYEQAMAEQEQQAAEQDSVDKPITSGKIAEAQMSEEDKRAILFSNPAVEDGGQRHTGTQDGDILNGIGAPFATRLAAARRANMEGKDWTIAPVFDGWVARRKDAFNAPVDGVQPAIAGSSEQGSNQPAPSVGSGIDDGNAVGADTAGYSGNAVGEPRQLPAGNDDAAVEQSTPALAETLPPTDIRLGDTVLVDGKPHRVTQGIEGGIAVESESVDLGNGVTNSETKFLKGDDAIRAKIAADKAGLNSQTSLAPAWWTDRSDDERKLLGKMSGFAGESSDWADLSEDQRATISKHYAEFSSGNTEKQDLTKADLDGLFGVDAKRQKAIDRIAKGTAYFGNALKAGEFIAKGGLKDTHEAVKTGDKRWDVRAKATIQTEIRQDISQPQEQTSAQATETVKSQTQPEAGPSSSVQEPAATAGVGGATKGVEKPSLRKAQAKRAADKEGLHMASGRAAFAEGKPRVLPSYFTNPGDKNSKDWYRGWDAANVEAPVAKAADAPAKPELAPLTKAMNDLMEVRQRIADQGQVVDDRLLSRERQLQALVKELESDGQNDELDAEMQSYEAKPNPTYSGETKAETKAPTATAAPAPSATETVVVKANTVFTEDAAAAARARLKAKLNRLNSGIDPEMLMDGIILSGYHIEKGARTFVAYARTMIDDLGDGVKPYLKSWYMASKYDPRMAGMDGLDDAATMDAVNLDSLEKPAEIADTGTEETPNEPTNPSQQDPQTLDGVPAAENIGPKGGRGVGRGGSGRGTRSKSNDSGLAEPGVSGTRSGGSGSTTVRAPTARKPRGGRLGSGGTGTDGSGLPTERSPEPVDLFNQPTEPVSVGNIQASNFRITEDVRLGQGGEAEKFRDNLAAIRALKAIETEGRRATSEEQRTLSRYVGWGGLASAFPNPETKEWKDDWKARGAELKDLLTQKEYDLARRSTLDSHYTSQTVVTAMWDAARRLGFKGGLTAETSMGIGNFIGLMPDAVAGNTRFIGVEYDSLTARMAGLLYPQSTVLHSGLQKVPLSDNAFDLNIGNPPFGDQSLRFQFKPEFNRVSIHNQFFLAGVDSLKPGGLQLNVVSRYLLDAMDKTTRTMLAKRAKLVAAIRLPDTAFKENARTSVVTDIVVLQRLTPAEEINMQAVFEAANSKPEKDFKAEAERKALAAQVPDWVEVGKMADPLGGDAMTVNSYFVQNPDMILGTLERSGKMQFKNDITVRQGTAELSELLAKAVAKLPEGIMNRTQEAIDESIARHKTMGDALKIALSGQEAGSIALNPDGVLEQVIERETPEGDYELAKRPLTADAPWSESLFQDAKGNWFTVEAKKDAEGNNLKVMKAGKDGKLEATKANVYERVVYKTEADIPSSKRLGEKNLDRLTSLVKLRDLMIAQINLETEDAPTLRMEGNRTKLREAYQAFTAAHGFISKSTNSALVANMPDGALVQALELSYRKAITLDKAKKMGEKPRPEQADPAPILTERVIPKYEPPTAAASPADALSIVLSETGRVDIARMASLLGKTEEAVTAEMFDQPDKPLIFKDPETQQWVTRNDYLTGQVKKKLHAAQAAGLDKHIRELEAVLPEAWGAENVTVLLGATFVPPQIYADFVQHMTGKPATVSYSQATNSYAVKGQPATTEKQDEFGAEGITIAEMISDMLNSSAIKVMTKDSDGNSVVDKERTDLAILKSRQIATEFTDWAFADSARRKTLVDLFNEKYNTRVNRQHDGSHLTLPGKVPDAILSMRRHQKNTIWRGISERFMLIDHVVGAGKTFTAIARAMERRRMGLSRKPAIIVPNHMVEQFKADVYRLYPGAKVLAAGKKDFEKSRRRKIFAKVASGDWDIVIIPHSSFGFIGIAPETEERYLEQELATAEQAIKDAWDESDEPEGSFRKPFNVKQAERLRDKITARMERLRGDKSKDRLLTFEQMGIDDLTVDEAHEFKNLFYSSKLTGVKGMGNPSGSQKAFDLYTKVRVLRESPTGTVTFMTGTPISNSAVEMFNMMRYLAADELKELGLEHFDAWRAQFVSTDSGWEPNETGRLKEVNRLGRSWSNMRSLMDLYYSFTDSVGNDDIKRAYAEDNAGKQFPIPKVMGGDRQSVVVKPTPEQIAVLEQTIADFDNLPGIEDPYERNIERLRLMDRARKVSLDVRAAVRGHPSKEAGGKLEKISAEVKRIYDKWTDDKGTQLIFLDRSVPKTKGDDKVLKEYDALVADRNAAIASDDETALRKVSDKLEKFDSEEMEAMRAAQAGGWNAYQQIKDNLIASGIPAGEIRFIQEATNDAQKQALFDQVKAGEVRVLIGSTPRMGAGTNVQDRLVGLHHADVTWKPSDIEQREGRIIRQGNKLLEKYGIDKFEVEILAYATERTIDAKMWNLNSAKLKTINAIRNYDGSFSMDFDDDDSVSMAELAALASGNPLLLERVKLDSEINNLELLRKQHQRKTWGFKGRLEDAENAIKSAGPDSERYGKLAEQARQGVDALEKDLADRSVVVEGKTFSAYGEAAKAVTESIKQQQGGDENAKFSVKIGERRLTSQAGALEALSDALGDSAPFLATANGTTYRGRTALARDIGKLATEAAPTMVHRDAKVLVSGKMLGFAFEATLNYGSFTGYSIDLALVDSSGRTVYAEETRRQQDGKFVTSSVTGPLGKLSESVNPSTFESNARFALQAAERAKKEIPELREKAALPFAKDGELKEKQARLAAVISELSSDAATAPTTPNGTQPTVFRAIYFSGIGSTPMSHDSVKSTVASVLKRIPNAPNVEVYRTPADAGITTSGPMPKGGTLPDGRVVVFSDANTGTLDMMRTVFHELFHRGLKSYFPSNADYIKFMLDLSTKYSVVRVGALNWRNSLDGKDKWAEFEAKGSMTGDRLANYEALAVEESLATLSETLRAGSPLQLRTWTRGIANMMESIARILKMERLADWIHGLNNTAVDDFVNEIIARSGNQPVQGTTSVLFRSGKASGRSIGEAVTNATNNVHDVTLPAGYTVGDLLKSAPGKLNWWHKTVGTMYNLAERSSVFKRVYDSVQNFINDVSYYATEAADLAPNILPKLEAWKDIGKSPLSAEDTKAISAPIFEGTLIWARDESGKPIKLEALEAQAASLSPEQKAQRLLRNDMVSQQVLKMWQGLPIEQYESIINGKYERDMLKAGVVWTDAELKAMFSLTDAQIPLYREFRKATDKSLTNLAISDMLRFGGKDTAPVREAALEAGSAMDAGVMLRDYLLSVADMDPTRSAVLIDTANKMIEKADKAQDLIARGYAPLSRYGQYTLDVVSADGERVYFGMFESKMDAARMARRMEQEYPGATMTRGTVSEEEYKLFAGVSPETLELFGDMLGLEAQGDSAASKAFQTYLKLAKSNRSSMKRMIQRKGIAGFSEDAGRVLAGFVYSNARQTASNLHMGEMTEAANEVSKTQGELKDQAVRLVDYVKNPREEAQAFRGLLFAQYIGGSVASAMVNMTQPITMTFPWLSQFGGPASAAKHLTAAMKDANKKLTGDAKLDAALKRAEEDGTVSPQEVHQLMQQAQGRGTLRSGDGTKAGDALATANNALSKFSLGWGKLFSLAEQFNRRATFIAAYRVAVEQGVKDPDTFARKAIAETQGVYNKGNKPAWARGAIGSTLFTFKQYSVAYTEMLHRMATQGGPEGKKAALLALGVLFLMSGAGGLPGGDDLDDLISFIMQRLGYNFDSKAKRKEFFASVVGEGGAQFLEHGVSGLPGMPLDVSGRLGMGNLIPGTGLLVKKADHTRDLAEIAGPAGDFGKRIFEAAGKTLDGDVLGLNGAVRTVAPKAFQNLYQSYDMANLGMYRDAKGMKVLDTDGMDATLKAIGFQPNDVKKVQDASFESQRMIGLNKLRESEIANRWALGIFEKDTDKVKAAREELAEWNATNPESQIRINFKQILQRVGKMNQTKAERIAATAPKEIRADVQRALAVQ